MEINILCCGECPFKMNHGAEYYSCYMNTDIVIDKDKLDAVNHECPMQNENITVKLGGDLGPVQPAEKIPSICHTCVHTKVCKVMGGESDPCSWWVQREIHRRR